MRFGLFGGAQATSGGTVTEAVLGYREHDDKAQPAEHLGYTHVFLDGALQQFASEVMPYFADDAAAAARRDAAAE